MDNPEKSSTAADNKSSKPTEAKPAGNKTSMSSTDLLNAIKRFNQIQTDYGRAQYEAEIASQASYKAAYRDYLEETQAIQEDTQKRCQEAYNNYMAKAQEASRQEDAPSQLATAQQEVMETMQSIQGETQRRCQEVYQRYLDRQYEIRNETYQRYKEAYRNYLSSTKDLWAQLDVNALVEAQALAAMA